MGSTGRAPTAALQADPMPAPRGVSGNLTGGPDGMAGAESMEQRAPEAKGEQGPWGSPSPTPPVSPLLLIPFNPRGDPCEGGSDPSGQRMPGKASEGVVLARGQTRCGGTRTGVCSPSVRPCGPF